MAGLLVSVRNEQEAVEAWQGGADIIDVKEPWRGSLGAAPIEVCHQIAHTLAGQIPLSVALGELTDSDLPRRLEQLPPVHFAKIGLAGCQRLADWSARWRWAVQCFPSGTSPVAVAYVDWQRASSPHPREVLRRAAEIGCQAMLYDTYDKLGGGLLQIMGIEPLGRVVEQTRQQGMLVVLAGSLALADLPAIRPLAPDFVAVRGAVCLGSRTGRIARERVRQFARELATDTGSSAPGGLLTHQGGADD